MKKFLLSILFLTLGGAAFADEPSAPKQQLTPEQTKRMMEATFDAMVPVMKKMSDAMLDSMLEKGAEPDTAIKMAKFKKNLYEALLKEGFTKEQAFSIMENTSMPSVTPAMK